MSRPSLHRGQPSTSPVLVLTRRHQPEPEVLPPFECLFVSSLGKPPPRGSQLDTVSAPTRDPAPPRRISTGLGGGFSGRARPCDPGSRLLAAPGTLTGQAGPPTSVLGPRPSGTAHTSTDVSMWSGLCCLQIPASPHVPSDYRASCSPLASLPQTRLSPTTSELTREHHDNP